MELALSTSAAPDLGLNAVLDACVRRGMSGLELGSGHAHGVAPHLSLSALDKLRSRVEGAGVRLVGWRTARRAALRDPELCRFAAALGVPVILPVGALPPSEVHALADRFATAGAALLLSHGTCVEEVARARRLTGPDRAGTLGVCWEVRPGADRADQTQPVLTAAAASLRHILLRGGGPEAVSQTGRGVGTLVARLTLARFQGPVVLAPSAPRFHQIWRAWLGRRSGWGCGSKSADATLVSLTT